LSDPDWTQHCTEPAVARLREVTGRDLWAEIGGCPRSWREAATVYRRLGVTNLSDAVTAVLGPPVDPKRATRGDIAMIDGALGIIRGEVVECIGGVWPIERATKAWHVTKG
jgi:hypothetical protein